MRSRARLRRSTAEYETRGLELLEVASGFRIQIRAAVAQPVARLWQERPAKYSRALLETLALIAYRQPITRGEIEQIRGVAVNPNIIKTLHERNWIRVVGHRDVPGKPELLGTTREFLDYFSLKKLDDLPTLAQLKELEDLRVQLTLPGAEAEVLTGSARAARCRGRNRRRRRTMRKSRARRAPRRERKGWLHAVRKTIPFDGRATPRPARARKGAFPQSQPRRPRMRRPASGCRNSCRRRASARAAKWNAGSANRG